MLYNRFRNEAFFQGGGGNLALPGRVGAVYFYSLNIAFGKSLRQSMDKLQLTGQNLGPVFNSRSGCMCAMHLCCYEAKQPILKLKTRSKQLLGSLPLAFVLPGQSFKFEVMVVLTKLLKLKAYLHVRF
jgi:hypothetical protein